ncbi:molybdopterin-dependent oxidoreductase [Shewanella benthica]|uniref:molybdopterin cofactor-binding domain-containing protein n=1 Tax=Shewanella benthica TaxID=43661 RepID=UPI00187A57CF|nr:molybdopterin cofactor-binding domain-containing protein [Shewanella benthica]MBE7216438.1 molybdopterin-dependent oxidoreductase [Shewanella benthica]MCL1064431.1 molybdopterin-dependent oxidoreductase [Shewanella benthica]
MSSFNHLGKRINRVDGLGKVTGKAIYGDDILIPGMLYGVCRYADIPAGKVLSIDTQVAEQVPGVVKIARFSDVPGNPYAGVIIRDYPPIIDNLVRFEGDVLAVIVAETYEAACLAADKIKIQYDVFTPICSVEDALKPGARLIQPGSDSNIVASHHTEKGDVDLAFAACALQIERTFNIGFQEHGYIEPESITAYIDPSSSNLVLTGSIQNPHRVRGFVASYLALPESDVDVRRSVLGGSFGGKDDTIDHLSCRAALMAQLTGRPVKFTYTREQSISESSKRHPFNMTYKVGFDDSGRIQAMKIDILVESGAYAACTPFVTWRSVVQAAGPYDIENVRVDIKGVYTNNTYTAAMRGFGSPQVVYANESLMDEIAEICHISAIKVRKINALKQDSLSITGQKFDKHKVSAVEVLERAVEESDYQAKLDKYSRLNTGTDHVKYGIGLALSYRGCSMGAEGVDTSSALVVLNSDGSVNISTGVCENGQGLQTTMTIIAAEVFGIAIGEVKFTEPPTSLISDGGPTVASRATVTGGAAVKDGAETLKARIFEVVASDLKVETLDQTLWCDGIICNRDLPELQISFKEAVNKAKWAGINLAAYGWFAQPEISWDEEKGTGSPYFTWVYGCQIAEVKVDTSTGKLELLHVTAVHDVGQVINKTGFEGQVAGGIAQGFGLGVLEDYNIEFGELKTKNLDSYLLPTIKDIPAIKIIAIENGDEACPFGAKSIGEPASELAAAAINNAACFALKKRIRQLPLTLEQLVLGYNLKKPARQSELLQDDGHKKHTHRLTDMHMVNPSDLTETLQLLSERGYRPFAGGTDLLVQGRLHYSDDKFVNILGIDGLNEIVETESEVRIGSAVCFNRILAHSSVRGHFPLLSQACQTIGSNQIRNRATIGGNIINAAPCADSVPPLLVYEAEVELQSANSSRRVPLSRFITGSYRTDIKAGELLTQVCIPKQNLGCVSHKYSQLGRRNALNISRLSISCLMGFDSEGKVDLCRIVDGSLFSHSQRLSAIEDLLIGSQLTSEAIGKAENQLLDMIDTAIGGRWSAKYKQPVFINMFKDLMNDIAVENSLEQRDAC